MDNLKKVLLINLGVLLGYNVLINLITWNDSSPQYSGMALAVSLMLIIALHVLLLLIISIIQFIRGKNQSGRVFLISTAIVLIVGFSACLGGVQLQQ